MARLKSSYRPQRFKDGGAVPLDVEIDTPRADVAADHATEQMLEAVSPTDEASNAFQRQIDALRESERIQKQRNEVAAFLKANPAMIQHPEITGQAEIEAQKQGHQYRSPAFFKAVQDNFTDHLNQYREELSDGYLEKMAELGEDVSDVSPVDRALEDARPSSLDYEPLSSVPSNRSGMYSAPISREVPSGSYSDRPGTVRMTPAMKEAARISGVSEREYAENVLRLREEKKSGNYGGAP
jgi:hypothetical protein